MDNLHSISARFFVDHCTEKLGWRDLSRDVIMDVGCGEEGYCAKAILEKFPRVGAIIAIDVNPIAVRSFRLKSMNKIECVVANIEERESLRNYEGKMSKVISTNTFHQLLRKEEAFRNVHRLLKPGGQAAILFVAQSLIYDWVTELLKRPKWKEAYQVAYVEDLYKSGFGINQYKEMVQKIGFEIIEGFEHLRVIPYPSDELCKEGLYKMTENAFKIPSGLLEEFKEDCFRVFLKLSPRDSKGRPCYRSNELCLLLLKPKVDSGSETKEIS